MRFKKTLTALSLSVVVAVCFLALSNSAAYASVSGKTIVLDPGHGGTDPGAVANGLEEKDVVLDVAERTKQKLEAGGAEVIMTRSGDVYVGLNERAQLANANQADSFVSIHANAAEQPSANGTETYHFPGSVEGSQLAMSLQSELIAELGTVNRGVKSANFNVLRNTTMPSALVEVAFLTNVQEAEQMKTASFRDQAAEAIHSGLNNYH